MRVSGKDSPSLTAGCSTKSKATDQNFLQGLNKHFLEHAECLLVDVRFPFETSNPQQTKQMDSLVKALLLDEARLHLMVCSSLIGVADTQDSFTVLKNVDDPMLLADDDPLCFSVTQQ